MFLVIVVSIFFTVAFTILGNDMNVSELKFPLKVTVTVTRGIACDLSIQESMTVPNIYVNNNTSFFIRQIPMLPSQAISGVKSIVDTKKATVTLGLRQRGVQQLQISLGQSTKGKVEHETMQIVLIYFLSHGVSVANKEGCGFIPKKDLPLSGQVWRWATGDWGFNVSNIAVLFRRTSGGQAVSLIGTRFKVKEIDDGSVQVLVGEKQGLVEVLVLEKLWPILACARELECFEGKNGSESENTIEGNMDISENGWWQFLLFAVGSLTIFTIIFILPFKFAFP